MILKEQGEKKVYSDGDAVEKEMLSVAREYPEDLSQDYIANNSKYTINNTFSSVRRNILNWYPFKEEADILEIGAGMGSLTGLFCDVANHVTALEMNRARADVIRARYPDRTNLEIVCDDINTFQGERKYDYVVFIGVLEYAAVFSEAENPFTEFLLSAIKWLKEDGKILFAIENRFGLKYWSGASEDHIGKPFVGIEGYEEKGTARTFSKAELEELLRDAGLGYHRFYYVFPDYKFPTIISTDEKQPDYMTLQNVSFTHAKDSILTFDEKKLYKGLIENGKLDFFANSYLVEASGTELEENHVIYVSARGECKKQYRVSTIIDSTGNVKKIAMHPEAHAHIEQEYQNEKLLASRGIQMLETWQEGDVLNSRLYKGTAAQDYFADLLKKNDRRGLVKFLDAFYQQILQSSELSFDEQNILHEAGLWDDAKGDIGRILKKGYIDMTFYNAFYDKGIFTFYDQEWCFTNVPADFILYYAIKCAYRRMSVNTTITWKEILSLEHLEANQKIYDQLEEYIWSTVLYRQTDFYGEDGYCRGYRIEDTLTGKMAALGNELENERQVREEWVSKANNLNTEKETLEERIKILDEAKKTLQKNLAVLEEDKSLLETEKEQIIRDRENKAGHIELLLQSERDLQADLRLIRESRAYRLIQLLWKANAKLMPAGSKRRRFVSGIYRKIRHREVKERREYAPLDFEFQNEPVVSIVIPAYNEFHYTYSCLESILKNSGTVSYEIILADDCSTDMTQNINDIVKGIIVSKTEENIRFLKNCNQAAALARGKYLLFLNNDTQVQPDWLQPLVELMENDATIGMTGSKLIYPDGTLQEAGGILWRDGSGWNYGHGQNPELPEYNYVKDVDYISGASLMIRKSLWDEIGGFDERYAPAYCEDSDLAFEVRAHNYRVVYQPKSVVVHFEGISNGTDVNSGVKKYQSENAKKLQEKWSQEFADQYKSGTNVFRARERGKGKKIILFVDHYVPHFDEDAGSKTIYQYLQLFVKKGYVVKFVGDNFYPHEPYTTVLQQLGVEVLYGSGYAENIYSWIRQNKEQIDFAFLNRPHISEKYIDVVKKCGIKTIYYGHDLHFLRIQREYELSGNKKKQREAKQWREREFSLMKKADISYYPSYVEIQHIHEINPDLPVKAITAYIYDIDEEIPYISENRSGILFVGGFGHPPNVDGIMWFVNNVWTQIRKTIKTPLRIVGSHPTDEIKNLDGKDGIEVRGFVSDEELESLYNQSRLVVVPLRYGAGVKGKVVEALAKGVPIVTTSVGAEGIPEIEDTVLVEDNPDLFAEKVVSLYEDSNRLKEFSHKSQMLIQKHFSSDAVWELIKDDFN